MSDHITLSTGATINANRGIVGIDADGNIYEGYDAHIEHYDYGDAELTNAERVELAGLMIARWTAYRSRWSNR